MYGIPENLDLQDIVGSDIQRICIGRYNVRFIFFGERSINVEGDIEILDSQVVCAKWDALNGWTSTAFQKLLNLPILTYRVSSHTCLEIAFENNLLLRLHDSSDQYESMQIYPEAIII